MHPEINQYFEGCTLFEHTTTNDNNQQPKIINLPDILCTPELFAEIAEHMDLTAIINLASTCKKMHQNYQVAQPNLYGLLAKAIGLPYDPKQPFKSQYIAHCEDLHKYSKKVHKRAEGLHGDNPLPESCSTNSIFQVKYTWSCLKTYNEWLVSYFINFGIDQNSSPPCRKLETLAQCHELKKELADWYIRHNGHIKSIANLNAQFCCLRYLPLEVALLSNLNVLRLCGNHFTDFPIEIENLIKLEHLSLEHNKLTSVPPALSSLSNLKILNLADNFIKSLPTEIGNLTSLNRLYINDNKLKTIPTEICNLNRLNFIHLSGNDFQLEELPTEVLTWANGKLQ